MRQVGRGHLKLYSWASLCGNSSCCLFYFLKQWLSNMKLKNQRILFSLISVFPNKSKCFTLTVFLQLQSHKRTILHQMNMGNDPSSLLCRDSNSQSLECQSPCHNHSTRAPAKVQLETYRGMQFSNKVTLFSVQKVFRNLHWSSN